jgi:serine O-acetyltransferase
LLSIFLTNKSHFSHFYSTKAKTGLKYMFANLRRDLNAIMERDPAASNRLAAIFLYPSFQVMLAYRLSHILWQMRLRFIARLIMQIARVLTGIEIHPAAKIGSGFFVDHGMGTVIGETAEIGRDVTLYHDVTLGGVMPAVDSDKQRAAKRHPTLGDYVIVGAGAQILGPITVHRCARVGGNSVVTKDVPEAATVVGVPARQMSKTTTKAEADTSFMAYGVQSGIDLDPRERTIRALVNEVQSQRARLSDLEDRLASAAAPASPKKVPRKTKPKPVS